MFSLPYLTRVLVIMSNIYAFFELLIKISKMEYGCRAKIDKSNQMVRNHCGILSTLLQIDFRGKVCSMHTYLYKPNTDMLCMIIYSICGVEYLY